MGLTAHFYKTKVLKHTDEPQDEPIAYFRNNWPLHNELGDGIYLLDEDKLKDIRRLAKEDEDFNKDYGDGESVRSGVKKALKALKENYIVYYDGSH